MFGQGRDKSVTVIKPVAWRQLGFVVFLLLCGFFFAFIDFLGLAVSWAGTVVLTLAGLLNLFDHLFEWSRLKIDRNGYHLRGWWRRESFRHDEIDGFETQDYANRKLIVIKLKSKANEAGDESCAKVPFPCAFGRPVDGVLEILSGNLDKTPGKRGKNLTN